MKTIIDLETRSNLINLYNERHRCYHTTTHIYDCLALLEEYSQNEKLCEKKYMCLETAIWFHDAVYNPKSNKNEENSADLCVNWLKNKYNVDKTDDVCVIIYSMIMSTKNHIPKTKLEEILCDIDMSIFGYSENEYERYLIEIEEEYQYIPTVTFNQNRKKFIENLLYAKPIFKTSYFSNKFETQAITNIKNELIAFDDY